jgi:ribonuclease P protein component
MTWATRSAGGAADPAGDLGGRSAVDGRSTPKRPRLSRSADFDRVFRQGRSHAGRELVLHVFPRGEEGEARLGLSVSRKVGGAVQRNRIKRLLREAFATESPRLPPGTDAVVVARREAGALAEREGVAGIRRVLGDLIGQVPGSEPPLGDGTEQPQNAPDGDDAAATQGPAHPSGEADPE